MYALSRLVYANIRGENTQSRWYNGNVRGSKTSIWGKYQRGGCQSQILECSTRPTACPQAEVHFSATELVPMMMMMMMILIYVQGELVKLAARDLPKGIGTC